MKYLYSDKQIDGRAPACYLLKYRGVSYYSCYGIRLETWLQYLYKRLNKSNSEGD